MRKNIIRICTLLCIGIFTIPMFGQAFSATSDGETTHLNGGEGIENEQITGYVSLEKVDEEENPLAGAEFTVYDESGNAISVMKTNSKGDAVSEALSYGTYSIKETKAPAGYELNDTVFNANINEDGITISLNDGNPIVDERAIGTGNLVIVSQRGVGSIYKIYDEDGNLVDTIEIGDDGTGTSSNLSYGKYCVEGEDTDFCFELSNDNQKQVYTDDSKSDVEQQSTSDNSDSSNDKVNENTAVESNNTSNGNETDVVNNQNETEDVSEEGSQGIFKDLSSTGSRNVIIILFLCLILAIGVWIKRKVNND